MDYQGNTYYYQYNLQGDVIALLDSTFTPVVTYTYGPWGTVEDITDSTNINLGTVNPFLYRGYYYDSDTELYYLQSRYYDPTTGRFINADGYVSTGQGLLSYNMFAYCENDPINRSDASGAFWKEIGDFFKRVGKAIADFAKATFGAEATNVYEAKQEVEQSPPVVNMIVTTKTGTKTSTTKSKRGNSSKPISVYAKGRLDNKALSSAGVKINISKFTFNINLGLDNIGISSSVRNGNTTNTVGISANLSQLKAGVEGSTTVKWDDYTDVTTYTNFSVTGWGIAAAYIFVTTGQWCPSPQEVY